MKKFTAYMTAMLFTLALATVAAASNGITDFTGGAYDRFDIGPVPGMNSVESVSAGGLRADDKDRYNGVTDFSGRSYDTGEIAIPAGKWMAGENAGGMRESGSLVNNGITDFTGKSLDSGAIGL